MPAFAPELRPELLDPSEAEAGAPVPLVAADDVEDVEETVDVDVVEERGRPTVVWLRWLEESVNVSLLRPCPASVPGRKSK